MTTLPLWPARCSALRPSPSPQVSLTCCREPWASSSTTERRSSSAVALSSCWPRERSVDGNEARNRRCSYFARIQRSRSSLKTRQKPESGCAVVFVQGNIPGNFTANRTDKLLSANQDKDMVRQPEPDPRLDWILVVP